MSGESINPKSNGRGGKRPGAGRPLGSKERATKANKATLEELARTYTDDALQVLVNVAKRSDSDSARVAAANALLDRGYGKPRQAVEYVPLDPAALEKLTDAELAEKADEARRRLKLVG